MLDAGTRLGPYEILSSAGAGGMGEVYRARDTRLDRTVAIKVLARNLSDRPEVYARFEREARAVSALNHPNICTLHDIGNDNGTPYLVMEFVEGETLADRLQRGPLAVTDAWHIALQIGEALDQAHRRGIVHRDLKPGNVMLTGGKGGNTVKLLDFGLAKIAEPVAAAGTLTSLPTVVKSLTQEGTIVGTFQYMAPEQLEGLEADHRSDIFAFGCVLYEMLAGRKAFTGKSQATLISAIMTSQPPPISSLQPMSPPALDRLVSKCLAKDPDDRWQSARDLVSELRWITESGSQIAMAPVLETRRRWHARWGWITAALVGAAFLASATVTVIHLLEKPPEPRAVRFQIPGPDGQTLVNAIPILSPDGRHVVFTVGGGATRWLYVRSLDSLELKPLPETLSGHHTFWSPDGRFIGFFGLLKLQKIDPLGGPPVTLANVQGSAGGSWNRENVILYAPTNTSPLMRIGAAGGTPAQVTKLDTAKGQSGHAWPWFLPDDRHFLFTVFSSQAASGGIFVGSLDSPQVSRLLGDQTNALYTAPGLILFTRGGTLTAQPFDAQKLRFTGDPFPVAERVAAVVRPSGSAFSAAAGTIAWRTGAAAGAPSRMSWFDRKGARLSDLGEPADYFHPELSPDGRSVAVAKRDPTGNSDIWVYDLNRGTSAKLTFDPANDEDPVWSPDGQRIAFSSDRKGQPAVYQKSANGTGQEDLVAQLDGGARTESWTADGKHLIASVGSRGQTEIWDLPLFGDRKPFAMLTGPRSITRGEVSPDGRWIAYMSFESGTYQVYVQNFPPAGGKWLISPGAGAVPRWRRDGKELFYVSDTAMLAVEVKTGAVHFEAGIPKELFALPTLAPRSTFAVTDDGQKFLMITQAVETGSDPITVVLNWLSGMRR